VDFVIAYESRQASSAAGFLDNQGIRIGHDSLVPISRRGPDGRPMFDLDRTDLAIPYLRFGPTAPISQHIEPLLNANNLNARLQVVYENSMAGALRIRVREGIGIAWLPKSLVAPDIEAGHVVQIGSPKWEVALEIKLLRTRRHGNAMTNKVWAFLERRESSYITPEPSVTGTASLHATPFQPLRCTTNRFARLAIDGLRKLAPRNPYHVWFVWFSPDRRCPELWVLRQLLRNLIKLQTTPAIQIWMLCCNFLGVLSAPHL
jgi:hypothetical protein